MELFSQSKPAVYRYIMYHGSQRLTAYSLYPHSGFPLNPKAVRRSHIRKRSAARPKRTAAQPQSRHIRYSYSKAVSRSTFESGQPLDQAGIPLRVFACVCKNAINWLFRFQLPVVFGVAFLFVCLSVPRCREHFAHVSWLPARCWKLVQMPIARTCRRSKLALCWITSVPKSYPRKPRPIWRRLYNTYLSPTPTGS